MAQPTDVFYEGASEAEAAFRKMFLALREGGVDLAGSNAARKLRNAESLVGEVREEIEDYGMEGVDA